MEMWPSPYFTLPIRAQSVESTTHSALMERTRPVDGLFAESMYPSLVRRPIWFRVLVAVWGLWFMAAFTDVADSACPMHGTNAVAMAAGTHDAHAGHHMGTQVDAHAPSHAPDQQHTTCTCLGVGCCGASVAAPTQATDVLAFVGVRVPVAAYRDIAAPVVARPHELPFANGPPARA